jgi:hypothetical protein
LRSFSPACRTPAFWSDDLNGDPYTDIANAQTAILQNTGFEANTLLLSFPVYQALRKHPLVIDRVKYTTRADATKITPELLASSFDVERCVVSKAVYNTSPEIATGAAGTYSFVASKDALLLHRAPAPGIMIPSAGYIFAWSGFTGLNTMGVRVAQIPAPLLGLETVRTEAEMAFDMQIVGGDLGFHFSGIALGCGDFIADARSEARFSAFRRTDPTFEPSLRQHQSPLPGNGILWGRDKGTETASENPIDNLQR